MSRSRGRGFGCFHAWSVGSARCARTCLVVVSRGPLRTRLSMGYLSRPCVRDLLAGIYGNATEESRCRWRANRTMRSIGRPRGGECSRGQMVSVCITPNWVAARSNSCRSRGGTTDQTLEARDEGARMSPGVAVRSQEGEELRSIPSLREPRYSQSLERWLAILESFTPEHPTLGIAELADLLGMSRSTTHRYAITLLALGFLEQGAGVDRKYRLSLRVTDLGMSALNSTGLSEHSRSYLEELRQRSTYTVSLAVLDGPEILYADRARSLRRGQHKIDLNLRVGSRLPAYCTALGKVLLAFLPDADQREVIAQVELAKRGPNTITTKKALLGELEHIREEGFAVSDEELTAGLISIAAPIRSESREVLAAINMAAHTDMISLEELIGQLLSHLLSTADQISARLGYRRDDEAAR